MDTPPPRDVLTAVAGDDLYALWWLAGLRGMRRGEVLGLRWTDVDLIDATLTVSQLVEIRGTVIAVETKTPAGNRTITLTHHRRRPHRPPAPASDTPSLLRHIFDERGYVSPGKTPTATTGLGYHRFPARCAHEMPPVGARPSSRPPR